MQPHRIYRFSIWLPIIVPMAAIVVMNVLLKGLGMPKPSGWLDLALEMIGWSGLMGGLPYALLAIWATWWVRDRSESDIRRLMFMAPVLMLAVWFVACVLVGSQAGRLEIWMNVAAHGASIIIPLGYGYVALTLLLRRWLGPCAAEGAA